MPVKDPALFSNAQKNSVSFGWPALPVAIFPANERGRSNVMFGSAVVLTRKSGDAK